VRWATLYDHWDSAFGPVSILELRLAAVLAAWGTLREGEVLGLQRGDVDVESMTVDVRRQLLELPVRDGGLQYGEPKSKAGIRKVAVPSTAAPLFIHHLETYVGPEQTACLFTGRTGKPLRPKARRTVFNSVRTQ